MIADLSFFLDPTKWRHHGLGMLQRELSEHTRVHVWHPSLVRVPDGGYRQIHDHRFDLQSFVVLGSIRDTSFEVTPADPRYGADTKMWAIKHAKMQDGDDCTFLGEVNVEKREEVILSAGSVYRIPRGDFHSSSIGVLTITIVHRSNFGEAPARVLGAEAHSAIAGNHSPYGHDVDLIADVLDRALQALRAA